MRCLTRRVHYALGFAVLCFLILLVYQARDIDNQLSHPSSHSDRNLHANYNYDPAAAGEDLVYYKKDLPLIWIGGVPRSGTTLMRAMLDAHRDIRCGEETRVIPRILGMHSGMEKSNIEMTRLREAKIDDTVLNSALGAYILSIIAKHGEPAAHLCNKDPFTLRSMSRLRVIFPRSKFLLMIRDGRATAHSIISRHVTIKGFDIRSYRGALRDWNRAIGAMHTECMKHGPKVCLPVHYEQLVLHPESQMKRILHFLEIPWDDAVMHHEKSIGKGISLSKKELSTDQVDKPVNTGALTAWVEHIPADVRKDMRSIAPMLETLGYDPDSYPPNYGTPDKEVAKNSKDLELVNKNSPIYKKTQEGDKQ